MPIAIENIKTITSIWLVGQGWKPLIVPHKSLLPMNASGDSKPYGIGPLKELYDKLI